jgi:hypothetical protein
VTDELPIWVYPLAGAMLFVALIAAGVRVYLSRRSERRNQQRIESIAYEVLRNVLIPNGSGGQLHLNYLLLTERGLLIIDMFVDSHWSQAALHLLQPAADFVRPYRGAEAAGG